MNDRHFGAQFEIAHWSVGHWTDPHGQTGCTAIIPDRSALAVADVRGGAPGTRELDLLRSGSLVQRLDAILLTGGSAFGLAAADGVSRWLREQGRGFPTAATPVPIVAAAVLYDLSGEELRWPDAQAGYEATRGARRTWHGGRIGAGTGATVGKIAGPQLATPAGIGASAIDTPAGCVLAICAVNAFGDVVDPERGTTLAGAGQENRWLDTRDTILGDGAITDSAGQNTTIGAVLIDAPMDRDSLVRVAIAAHDGLARAIRPAHTLFDGDTIFAATVHEGTPNAKIVLQLCVAAEMAVEQAIVASVAAAGQ